MSLHHLPMIVRGLNLLYFDCFQGVTSTYRSIKLYKEIKKGHVYIYICTYFTMSSISSNKTVLSLAGSGAYIVIDNINKEPSKY